MFKEDGQMSGQCVFHCTRLLPYTLLLLLFYYYLESHCTVQAELELAFHKASLCYSLPSTGNTGWATIMPSSHICHNL